MVVSGGPSTQQPCYCVLLLLLLLLLLLRIKPQDPGDSSGVLGRNYMVYNTTFMVGVNPFRINRTAWQKTLGMNDYYDASELTPFPLGNLQTLGSFAL